MNDAVLTDEQICQIMKQIEAKANKCKEDICNEYGLTQSQYLFYDMFKMMMQYVRDPNICVKKCDDILGFIKAR